MLIIPLIQQLKLRQEACSRSTGAGTSEEWGSSALAPTLFFIPPTKPRLTNVMTCASPLYVCFPLNL